ncbi:putative EF-hand calcium-binding domain protein [Aspergillus nomiae NRRL 13137]|uniref:Putative EF-hand calcium-binding domain protein n=1 Tax=Aspergillus nomiae NRRL (strain ATCC 15546 / NRRL 13137 / CBS 260.88 / M93) TaxID=1509407 RepID=A0A0L1ILX8_ASPN3|nr:putative EF-hand calcium-binding domain protein [Aspergillus nomiae NRRL 13137]KNG80569.1 putative EF-hand calcium-binding domain protein [Aspergillus nomiae NRRL 13137]
MRILCLHGRGTSAQIFRSQTTSFRSRLEDLPITFDFIDAPYTTTAASGIDLFYEPPYYTFWRNDSIPDIYKARDWLLDLISEKGPYDAVLSFSQGCSLAALTLLLHAHETPHAPPPFKAAIFICGGAPLPLLEELGYNITPEMQAQDAASRKKLSIQADSASILAKGADRWSGSDDAGEVIDEERIRGEIERCANGAVKIGVPTVHVYGRKDPRFAAGVLLSGVCEESNRRVFDHGGGHDIPRTSVVSDRLAELVRWVLQEGSLV